MSTLTAVQINGCRLLAHHIVQPPHVDDFFDSKNGGRDEKNANLKATNRILNRNQKGFSPFT